MSRRGRGDTLGWKLTGDASPMPAQVMVAPWHPVRSGGPPNTITR
jgi:hypothetical protein